MSRAATQTEPVSPYDEVPYESFSYPQTHPSHLSAIATLFGLTPPDFRTARVLELGCSSGGNLLPLAYRYPDATFLGIDLSQEQITLAGRQKQAFGLRNISFEQQDINAFAPKDKKKFDYIICHGIFSWVPEPVRAGIFRLCSEWLSPQGVAIISYNTLPGWNAVRSLREMMLYHISRFTNPAERIQQARFLLDFLAENALASNTGYRELIQDERQRLKKLNDTYLYHDHLERENTQFYFSDFMRMAQAQGLDYVGDTGVASMYVGNMPAKAVKALNAINDIVRQEQYMDFIANRRFRSSILCKKGPKLNRKLQRERIMDYFLTAAVAPVDPNPDPNKDVTFRSRGGGTFVTRDPVTGTLFLELAACGLKPVAAGELVARVQKKLGLPDPRPVQEKLVANGMRLVFRGFVNLHSDTASFVTEISPKPVAYPLARLQAGMENCRLVTNAVSVYIPSNPAVNLILQKADGTKTVAELAEILAKSGQPVANAAAMTDEILRRMSKLALLVG